MDLLDKQILNDLQRNCRTPYQELARKYGISANAIKKRVAKLEASGAIDGYSVMLSAAMLGAEFAFGFLQTDGTQDDEEFVNRIGAHPNIIAASSYSDGHYALVAEYTSPENLREIGVFLRNLPSVETADLDPYLSQKGGTIELTKLHLRALSTLIENPRMTIAEAARNTGLTARRMRRLVNEMIASEGVNFRARQEPGVAGSIPFLLELTWDEQAVDHSEVVAWLQETYPLPLSGVYVLVAEPKMFCLFVVNTLPELDIIARSIRKQGYIRSVKVTISTHHKYFPGLRTTRLTEMIQAAMSEKP